METKEGKIPENTDDKGFLEAHMTEKEKINTEVSKSKNKENCIIDEIYIKDINENIRIINSYE